MRRTAWVWLWAFAVAGPAACASDPEIGGIYQTTVHTLNTMGCEEGPPDGDNPYFQIKKQDLLGHIVYGFGTCTSADPGSCTDLGLFSIAFTLPGENGWTGATASASSDGSQMCSLGYSESSATLQAGGGVHVELRTYLQDVMLSPDACTTDEAERRGTSLPCTRYEKIEGTRVR